MCWSNRFRAASAEPVATRPGNIEQRNEPTADEAIGDAFEPDGRALVEAH